MMNPFRKTRQAKGELEESSLDRLATPNRDVLANMLAEFRPVLLGFAQLQLRDAALAEDAVQETLLAALACSDGFSGRSQYRTWVFGILKNKVIDLIRHGQRQISASNWQAEGEDIDAAIDRMFSENAHWSSDFRPVAWVAPDQSLENKQFWRVLEACLLHLPENTARVFMMREFMEFETPEICRELGVSTTHCHVILHRARASLRRCLESSWFAPGGVRP